MSFPLKNSLDESIIVVKHFCYQCNEEIDTISEGNTCSRCHSGFIEELVGNNDLNKNDDNLDTNEEVVGSVKLCSICLEGVDTSDTENKVLDCSHVFHKTCIKTWFANNNTCPLCRVKVNVQGIMTPIRRTQLRCNCLDWMYRPRLLDLGGRDQPIVRPITSLNSIADGLSAPTMRANLSDDSDGQPLMNEPENN